MRAPTSHPDRSGWWLVLIGVCALFAYYLATKGPTTIYVGFACPGYGAEDVKVSDHARDVATCARVEAHQYGGR